MFPKFGVLHFSSFITSSVGGDKDLMEKYHNQKDIVDAIINSKEECADYTNNPDYKDQRLYNCWDATAKIKDDSHETSTDVRMEGDIAGGDAIGMLPSPQFENKKSYASI